jgi:hypothetical protein
MSRQHARAPAIQTERAPTSEPASPPVRLPPGILRYYGIEPPRRAADPVQALYGGPPVQPLGGESDGTAAQVQDTAKQGMQGSPQPLPHLEVLKRSFGRYGALLDKVRAFIGGPSAVAAEAIGAQAYAQSGTVVFKSTPTLFEAAHEATHALEQLAGLVSLPGGVGEKGDGYEAFADQVAALVVSGQSVEAVLRSRLGDAQGGTPGEAVQRFAPTTRPAKGMPRPDTPTLADHLQDLLNGGTLMGPQVGNVKLALQEALKAKPNVAKLKVWLNGLLTDEYLDSYDNGSFKANATGDELPPSEVGFTADGNGNPSRVKANPLSAYPGNTKGSAPNGDPNGWPYVNLLDPPGNLWVRFHVLNDNVHGPGTVNNLVPALKRHNSGPAWSQFESQVKSLVLDQGRVLDFQVDITYYAANYYNADPNAVPAAKRYVGHFPDKIVGQYQAHALDNQQGVKSAVAPGSVTLNIKAPDPDPANIQSELGDCTEAYLKNKLGIADGIAHLMVGLYYGKTTAHLQTTQDLYEDIRLAAYVAKQDPNVWVTPHWNTVEQALSRNAGAQLVLHAGRAYTGPANTCYEYTLDDPRALGKFGIDNKIVTLFQNNSFPGATTAQDVYDVLARDAKDLSLLNTEFDKITNALAATTGNVLRLQRLGKPVAAVVMKKASGPPKLTKEQSKQKQQDELFALLDRPAKAPAPAQPKPVQDAPKPAKREEFQRTNKMFDERKPEHAKKPYETPKDRHRSQRHAMVKLINDNKPAVSTGGRYIIECDEVYKEFQQNIEMAVDESHESMLIETAERGILAIANKFACKPPSDGTDKRNDDPPDDNSMIY